MLNDLIIIGAGPAGLSAAIYASRAQLKTLLFGDHTKSNLYKSHRISNYFALLGEPSGRELAENGLKQALSFGTEYLPRSIVKIEQHHDRTFTVKDNFNNFYQTKTIIIATGQGFVSTGIKGEQEYLGKGVSYCVTCDGPLYKKKRLSVIGNGDFAAEEALELANYTPFIQLLSHGRAFEINSLLLQELDKKNIARIPTARITEFQGPKRLNKILTADHQEIPADGVFMAIGLAGANSFAKKLGLEMKENYIKVNHQGSTNIPGIFAAGDCTGSPPQVAVNVGNGCIAALSAIKLVRGLKVYIQYN